MASYCSALALISICIVLCLSGLGDCRIPFQKEALVGEKEQSVDLLLPSEEEKSSEMQAFRLPLERTDLRGKDGIFHGERSTRFRFGRRGQRKNEHMPFPTEFPGVLPHSTDFQPRVEEFRPLPEENDFDHAFSNREGRQQRHWHPEEEKRERDEHMPFPEYFFHPFHAHADSAEFHPRVKEFWPYPMETEFVHRFPNGGEGRQHKEEGEREKDNEHMDSFSHAFPVEIESTEFRSRVDEFLPLPRERDFEHGFPGGDGRHGHGHREEDKGEKENEHIPFPTKGEQTESFSYNFPVQAESTESNSRVEELLRGSQGILMGREKKKKERKC